MKQNYNFEYDLEFGHEGEGIIADMFENKKIEVKRDNWVGRTGNIAIEYKSRGKPSGIATTQADYWIIMFSKEYEDKFMFIIETQRLKEVTKKYFNKGSIKKMGDSNTSSAVLIPIKEINNFAI
tara:strand:+ start:783 stop:1154 length:372 start_codon:yes stop_codon:yes gene_type:complete